MGGKQAGLSTNVKGIAVAVVGTGLGLMALAFLGNRGRAPEMRAVGKGATPVSSTERDVARAKAAAQADAKAAAEQAKLDAFKAAQDADVAQRRGEIFAMSPKEREALMVERVSFGEIAKATEILDLAQTPAEKAKLTAAFAAAEAARQRAIAKDADKARRTFASNFETRLFEQHMNPDGVSAVGSTLAVRGWFCSRQFCFNFTNGAISKDARAVGFKQMTCSNALESYTQELLPGAVRREGGPRAHERGSVDEPLAFLVPTPETNAT